MKELVDSIEKKAYVYGAIYALSNRLQALGDKFDSSISTKQWFVLAAITKFNNKTPNIGDVANLLGTSRQNVKKIAIILEKRGYLELRKDNNDLRNIQLILTESCYTYLKSRVKREDEYIEELFCGIDDAMLSSLYYGMKSLIENTDKMKKKGDSKG